MQFVMWAAGVMAIIVALKFLVRFFKRISSKENMDDIIDRAGEGIRNTADKAADWVKNRRKEKNNQPTVTIR